MEPSIRVAVRLELRVSLEPFGILNPCVSGFILLSHFWKGFRKKKKERQMPTGYCHSTEGDRHRAGTWLCSNMELGNFEVVTSDRHVFRVCSFQWGLGMEAADGTIHCIETNQRKMVWWHGPRTWHYCEAPGLSMLGKWKQSLRKIQQSFLNGVVVRPRGLLSPP